VSSDREEDSDPQHLQDPGDQKCKSPTLQLTLGFTASGHFYGLVDDSRGMSYFPHNSRESS